MSAVLLAYDSSTKISDIVFSAPTDASGNSIGLKQLQFTTTEEEAAVQGIRQRLLTWQGEWFLNTKVGIPYIQRILVKNPNSRIVESLFRAAILKVPEIQTVPLVTLEVNRATRAATLTWTATLASGKTIRSEDYESFVLGSF